MQKKFLLYFFILLTTVIRIYGEISISASVDKNEISLSDQLTLQVTVTGKISNLPNPTIPTIPDFQIYSSGRSQNITIINGQINSSVVFNYILSPRKVGEFIIEPFSINYQGKVYQTQPITIKVVQGKVKQLPVENNVYKGESKGLFVEMLVDKKSAYVNEQITMTFRFYTKVNLMSQPQYTAPTLTGFLVEDLPPQRNYYTTIAGERYYVSEIKTALFAVSAGKLQIGSAVVRCMVEDFNSEDFFSDRFFKQFFSSGKEVVLKTEPININILPLPQTSSESADAVGEYFIKSSVDKTKTEVNQTIMLNIEILGTGNIKAVTLPEKVIKEVLSKSFVVFDPISSFDINKENYIVKGKKIFQIPIAPTVQGQLEIPSIKFIYFDPIEKKYKNIFTKPILINVSPSKETDSSLQESYFTKEARKEGQKISIQDIRYIKLSHKIVNHTSFSIRWFFLQTIPLFVYIIFLGYFNYRKLLSEDIRKFRFSRAFKVFKAQIIKLKKMKNKNYYDKINILYDIFTNYFADKLNLSREIITAETIKKSYDKKLDTKTIEEILSLWEELNFYRFSKTKDKVNEFEQILGLTEKIISKLEYELQKI